MRSAIVAVALAALSSTALAQSGDGEAFTPSFARGVTLDLIDAYGLGGGRVGGQSEYEGDFSGVTMTDVSAGSPSFLTLSADRLTVGGVKEPRPGSGQRWLTVSDIRVEGLKVGFLGFAVEIPRLDVEGVQLLNGNDDEETAANGYEYIDGRFAAMRFASVRGSGAEVAAAGVALATLLSFEVKASEWLETRAFPLTASLTASGTLTAAGTARLSAAAGAPERRDADAFALIAHWDLNKQFKQLTAAVSAKTARSGSLTAKLDVSGLSSITASDALEAASEGRAVAPELTRASLSRLAVGTEGLGWAAAVPALAPDALASGLGLQPSAADALREIVEHALRNEASVSTVEPAVRLPLEGLLIGGSAPVGEIEVAH